VLPQNSIVGSGHGSDPSCYQIFCDLCENSEKALKNYITTSTINTP